MQPEVTTVINKSETSSVVTLIVGEQRYSIFLPNHESDYIQKKIMAEKKPYELQMLEDIQQRVQQDDLVLDIGANIGNHTLYIAAISGCKVIAFEPNQALIGALLASIELNDLSSRVSVRALGLGKTKAKGHFEKEFPDNLGAQSIVVGDGGIQIVSLDSLQFEQPVKLLKIDVEGMEFQVLQGAEALLRKDRPILYVECQTENDFRSVTGWLDSQGYSYWDTFNATPTHLFLPNEQVDIDRRLSRLQFKDVLGVYKASEKLAATRIRLEDANTKYRTASETISSLKERLAEEKTQHKNTQARLTEESEFLNTRLNEVNLKYRAITEQIPGLKSTIKELTVAKNKAEAALNAVNQDTLLAKQQVAQLQDELAALQIRLAGLDQEHQLQVAQIAALESQLEQERASRQEAETVLLATRQQAEETLHRQESERHALEQERAALNQQVEQLSQHSAHQHETLKLLVLMEN